MMLGRQSGLGRGLGALIPPKPSAPPPPPATAVAEDEPGFTRQEAVSSGAVLQLAIQDIAANPQQPRAHFDHAHMEELIQSVQEHGILQPLLVLPLGQGKYQLIAGERRLRAATMAGLVHVPALVREADEQNQLELALIENIQRQDLNPIEEALAYARLMDEFHLAQEEIARKVGKSRPQVANIIRLLQLPEEIQRALIDGRISASNGRTLLSLPTEEQRLELFQALLAGQFTVRQTEARVPHPRGRRRLKDVNIAAVEEQLRQTLHCKIRITPDPAGGGEIRLSYFSEEEFRALLEKLGRGEA